MTAPDVGGLFSPRRLAGVTLPNRFVMPGMQRGWCEDGTPDARLADYYRARAEGGVGLIISESVAVDHPSATRSEFFARLTPATLPAWTACVGAVKDAGGHMLLQLWHEGAIREETGLDAWSEHPTLSPSGLAYAGRANGRAATIGEIREIRDAFVRSAALAQAAGADGVEVHGAHGYLLDQFLWHETNRRDDEYGGSRLRDRARLLAEIIIGIRDACGPDFIVSVRISQWKEADFDARIAASPEEFGELLDVIAAAGADAVHASTRRFWQPEWEGSERSLAGWAASLGRLPVITVGSVGLRAAIMERPGEAGALGAGGGGLVSGCPDASVAVDDAGVIESSLRELARRFDAGDFELVAVGRSLIADPDWVRKVESGDLAGVRVYRRDDLGVGQHTGGSIALPTMP
ncbi:MAG: 12-oxophytodienoate reductase [Pseudoclavibacter sp.]